MKENLTTLSLNTEPKLPKKLDILDQQKHIIKETFEGKNQILKYIDRIIEEREFVGKGIAPLKELRYNVDHDVTGINIVDRIQNPDYGLTYGQIECIESIVKENVLDRIDDEPQVQAPRVAKWKPPFNADNLDGTKPPEILSDDYLRESTFVETNQESESVDDQVSTELEDQEEIEDKGFGDIRYEYAIEQAKWKKEQGELKVKFNRIMEDLSRKVDSVGEKIVEKVSGKEINPEKASRTWNPPQREIPEPLKEAKRNYINAKKEQLKERLKDVSEDEKMEVILEFEQKEFDVMQKLIQEELADTEQSLHKKVFYGGLKKWRKLSPAGRIAVSSTLMGVGGAVAFGSAGIIPVAGAVAYRAVRGGLGALASYGTARSVDAIYGKYMRERDAQRKNEVLKNNKQEYTVDLDKYEEIEKKSREYFENEQKRLKYKNIAKASAAVLVGGAVNYGMNLGVGSYNHIETPTPKVGGGVPDVTESETLITPPAPKNIEIQTDLSSKGFIKTFDDLKEKILKEYAGDAKKLPENLKKFVETSSTKLAIDNGLYDPTHHASAMGLKGEHLSVDQDGHLSLKHLGSKPEETIDTGAHKFNVLHPDKMLVQESTVPPPVSSEHHEGPSEAGSPNEGGEEGLKVVESRPEPDVSPVDETLDQIQRYAQTESVDNLARTEIGTNTSMGFLSEIKTTPEGVRQWIPKGSMTPFASEHVFGDKKVLQLSDALQDGGQFADTRAQFVGVFNELVNADSLGKKVIPVPFEKGIAHIIQAEDNKVNILLNGKEIARGAIDTKGAHVKLLPGMTHGGVFRLFFADSVYERALSSTAIKEAIKTLKISQ